MSIELEIRLASEVIFPGADCWVEYTVRNTSDQPESLRDPSPGRDSPPTFYLRRLEPEVQTILSPRGGRPAEFISLEPGASHESAFQLGLKVTLEPGAYEMIAILDPDGLNAASNPLEFTVEAIAAAEVRMTEFGIPNPARVDFTWIQKSDSGFWEQYIAEEGGEDRDPFERGPAVRRLTLPEDASDPCTPAGGAHPTEPEPLRWIFYRSGQTLFGKGPSLMDPPMAELPPDAGALAATPVMGAMHRADLFYRAGRDILAVRFTDPYVTPGESTGVLGRLPLPTETTGAVQIAIDSPLSGLDQRHIVALDFHGEGISLHHATLNAQGVFSAWTTHTWKTEHELTAFPGLKPAVLFGADGTLRVLLAASGGTGKKSYGIELTLDAARGARIQEFELEDAAVDARVCFGSQGAASGIAWWLTDGRIVASRNWAPAKIVFTPSPAANALGLVGLESGVYLATVGTKGFQLELI